MEKFYKKFVILVLLPVVLASFPFLVIASDPKSAPYDWYFKPTNDGSRPEVIPEADFIDGYDVLYLGADEPTLYLTFDAGYENGCTAKILNALRDKNVRAAFFLDGNFVKSNPELVKRIAAEGHLVCNHSKNHPDMTKYRTFEEYSAQITDWEEQVSALGVTPQKLFRFPAGRFSERALEYNERLGVRSVFWSFAYCDWLQDDQPEPSAAMEKICSRVHNGAVMLLHSTSATNAEIMPELIDRLRAMGYNFALLPTSS